MSLDGGKRESQLMNQSLDLSQFADAGPLERRDSQVLLRKDLDKIHKTFYKDNCSLGERKQSAFSGSVGYRF